MNGIKSTSFRSLLWRHLFFFGVIALTVYGTFRLGRINDGVSLVWPGNGILLSLLLMSDRRFLFSYAAVGSIASAGTACYLFGTSPLMKVFLCLVLFGQTAGTAWLLGRDRAWVSGKDDGLKSWLRFLLLGVLAIPLADALLSSAIITVFHGGNYIETCLDWFMSVVLGIAIFVPLLLRWRPRLVRAQTSRGQMAEILALTGLFAVASVLILGQSRFLWLFALFPLIVIIIFRVGIRGLALALLALTVVTLWFVFHHKGPFEAVAGQRPAEDYRMAQAYILLSWVTFYLIAGLIHDRQRLHELVQAGKEHERRHAEKELEESERRFRLLLEYAGDSYFLHDDRGRIFEVNHQACDSLGYSHEELLALNVKDLAAQIDYDGLLQAWDATEPGRSITVSNHVHRRRDGSVFPVEVRVTCYSIAGKKLFLAAVRDVTERVEAEGAIRRLNEELEQRVIQRTEALRESEARWQFALDGSGDGVWDWNVKTGRVFYSRQWKAMLGYADEEVGNSTNDWSDRIHPGDKDRSWRTIEEHFKGNAPVFTLEHRMRAKDGSWRWILDRGKIVERAPDGSPARVIGTHTDITERKQIEERLAARERWLSEMVENLPLGAIFVTGERLRINRAAEQITGYGRDELATRDDWFTKLWREMHEKLMPLYQEDRRNGFRQVVHVPFYRKDGQLRTAEFAATLVGEHEIWLMRDITESEQLQIQLTALTDNLPNGAVYQTVEMPDGRISYPYMSAGIFALTGIPAAEIMENPLALRQTIHDKDLPRLREAEQQSRLSGGPFNCQFRHRARDGRQVWVHARSAPRSGPNGATIWDGVVMDVTERKEAENRIRALNERIQLAVKAGRIGIWELDFGTGRFIWDEQMHSLYGMKEGEFGGSLEEWSGLLHPEDVAKTLRDWELAIAETSAFEGEFRIQLPSAGLRYIRALARIIRKPDGSPQRAYGTNWDITAERQTAEALQKAKDLAETAERVKSEFLAMMSHEIRTPLNGIIGFISLLKDTGLGKEQKSYVQAIHTSGETLISIVNDILDYSKIEAKKIDLEEIEFLLADCLQSAIDMVSVQAAEKGLRLDCKIGPGVPAEIVGDLVRIRQILANLLSNAVKFTGKGGVSVDVTVEEGAGGLPVLHFIVRDTGIGMPKERMAQLFQPFSQLDASTTRRFGGTGLGLAICFRLVELMKGAIWFESRIDAGTTAHVSIPLSRPGSASPGTQVLPVSGVPAGSADADRFALAPRTRALRILLAEDHSVNQTFMIQLLQRMGIRSVQVVCDGVEACEAVLEGTHDVILMDCRMPRLDGYAATRYIRSLEKKDPARARVYIIAVTASAIYGDRQKALDSGMDDYLTKPLKPEDLKSALVLAANHCAANKQKDPHDE